MIHDSVLSLVGKTPLVRMRRVCPNPRVTICAKIESRNPGGSIKDRVALAMIEAAERSGELTSGRTVIEATSGNTGIGLAMVCAVKGYPLKLLMPASASEERKRIMRAYGAEIVLTPGNRGTDGAIEEAYRLAREEPDRYVLMDQFNNPASIEAHYAATAVEIFESTGGAVTHVVAALGTSGTAMGLVKKLKELNPAITVAAVEPRPGHKIQGLKNMQESYPPGIFNKHALDAIVPVEDEDAFAMARRLARDEGILAGMSGGAAMAAAARLAGELAEGLIVVILADSGERYLSTTLFAAPEKKGVALTSVGQPDPVHLDPAAAAPGLFTFGPPLPEPGDLDAWRRIVTLDVLRRTLSRSGGRPTLAVGLADLDDRCLDASRAAGRKCREYAAEAREQVAALAESLGVADAVFPLAGEAMDEAMALARKLMDKGLAYEKLRSVYFDVARDKAYGGLLGLDMTKLCLGKTVDLDSYAKDHPRDFTLLKRVSLKDLKAGDVWATAWGNVRPSWFLQMASAAVRALPAVTVVATDEDKTFPHIENLRAVWAGGAGLAPAVWLVGGRICGREGAEAVPTLADLLGYGVHPLTVRAWLLSTSYHKPLCAAPEALAMWERNRARIQELAAGLTLAAGEGQPSGAAQAEAEGLEAALEAALAEDLSVAQFWPALFAFARQANAGLAAGTLGGADAARHLAALAAADAALGLLDPAGLPLSPPHWPAEAARLIEARAQARAAKDFTRADALRRDIEAMGLRLEDAPGGARLFAARPSPGRGKP
ncbi:cysteine synthase [Solidesulfovibrio magneticus]|uniref:cysteine synthase n=1 Tax=Solidesulfovibrio magneticus (strain ATCC 700980 / DSM 13731 / RS-1) TaxID=573370 RepID=C4XII8_SOLM1|nr:cysteine synthase [Solidesulfovibrio magneticus]BAH76563.1 cysteine synthase B [Solidesulfovibrio magneticus RS-1]